MVARGRDDRRDGLQRGSTREVSAVRKPSFSLDGADGYITIGTYQN